MKRLEGSYCPGCGELGLALKVKGKQEWAYCARNGAALEESHTSFVVRELSAEPEKMAGSRREPKQEQEAKE